MKLNGKKDRGGPVFHCVRCNYPMLRGASQCSVCAERPWAKPRGEKRRGDKYLLLGSAAALVEVCA